MEVNRDKFSIQGSAVEEEIEILFTGVMGSDVPAAWLSLYDGDSENGRIDRAKFVTLRNVLADANYPLLGGYVGVTFKKLSADAITPDHTIVSPLELAEAVADEFQWQLEGKQLVEDQRIEVKLDGNLLSIKGNVYSLEGEARLMFRCGYSDFTASLQHGTLLSCISQD